MNFYSYVVARDYGFAPNPFGPYCTLATCKPNIRRAASKGDWIVGTGSARCHGTTNLVFAMKVSEKLTFNEYWRDPRFLYKRPVLNGSLKQTYGDNIYYCKRGKWHQADSHHSNEDGSVNTYNLERDTSYPYVLISDHFFYFGRNAARIPKRFRGQSGECISKRGPGHRCRFSSPFVVRFIQWLTSKYSPGYFGDPALFTHFERYDGVS